MKVLIIEDEKPASRKLSRMLGSLDETIEVIGTPESVEESINWFLQNSPPDLVFMDIQLDDGLCFEIFENIEIKTPVIFTTAYDKYAIKAFKVNSVDYLLKPIGEEDLVNAIEKYRLYHENKADYSMISDILSQLNPGRRERILVKAGHHYRSIQINDIHCFFVRERSVFINTGSGNDYAIDFSLDRAEKIIDPKFFFRISRNYIVNYHAIKDIIAYSSSRLKLILKGFNAPDDIIVSRERVSDFKNWMNR